ncbi:suppressor of cytokine signaling 1a [Etheostoma cragini]|uniref:suppressor of cytokine signaling 1a n=1 Tax=Etheostoma cragini TaxID=417921 RepID=UPI00155E5914|nr:suppressor of cytokine signaling 1a [Etheostoma cragini]
MVADSTVEGHDKTQLSSSSSSSSASSSSSLSSSSSPLSLPPARPELALSSHRTELEQLQRRAAPDPNPRSASVPTVYLTHFPTFSCKEDCKIITDTAAKLEHSPFYWGPLGVEDAHRMLRDAPLGSFLIRDSRQKDVFFTLSYHGKSGPVSVRIDYKRQKFSLAGNERSFPTLFALLEHYINSPKKSLSIPYRKWKPTLQELCRKRIMELCGGGSRVSELPLTHVVQDFLLEFPYKL